MNDGTEPISDDELLYRRVPLTWYSPQNGLDAQAFAPHKTLDTTGLSMARAKYKSKEEVAAGQPGKSYYVAVLRAGDVRKAQIEPVPRPEPNDPGHSELPDLNSQNRKSDRTQGLQRILVAITLSVEGPFSAPDSKQE